MNKKKETEEVLKTFLESCVKEINEEFERELFVKRSHVENAEKRLTETFSISCVSLQRTRTTNATAFTYHH